MRANIEFEASYAFLVVDLDDGESINAEPGAMVTQQNVELSTGINGRKGVFGGFKNIMGGESFFINTFTGGHLGGARSPSLPPLPAT